MHVLPVYSVDLINELDKMYPVFTPSDDISDKQLWGQVYQRRLIDHLKFLTNDNNNESDN
jgi:hypothetical protein